MSSDTSRGSPLGGIELSRASRLRLEQVGLLVVIVTVLEYVGRSGAVGPAVFVPPSQMVTTLYGMVVSGSIFDDLVTTLVSVVLSFVLAVAVGFPAGWYLWRRRFLQSVLDPYLIVLYAIPIFVFYPILIVIFGINKFPIVLIAFAMSVTIIVINTANGFGQVPDVLTDVGRALNLSQWKAFRHIYFPAAVPYVFTGLKLGFIYAFIGVIASEFILSNAGLGYGVSTSYENFQTAAMYAYIIVIVCIAVVVNLSLIKVENHLYHRRVTT